MKKHVFGRQLKRDANERKALFKGLITELVLHETITTTQQKAEAIRSRAEKLVTKAKKRKSEAKQFLTPYLSDLAAEKVIKELSNRFADRPGGYTRIIKLGTRFSDNAPMAIIEWVERAVKADIITPRKQKHEKEQEVVAADVVISDEKQSKSAKKEPEKKSAAKKDSNKKEGEKKK